MVPLVTVGSGEVQPGLKPGLQLLGQLFLPWFAEPVPPSIRPAEFGDLRLVPCELPEPGTLTARPPHQTVGLDPPSTLRTVRLQGQNGGSLGTRSEPPTPQNCPASHVGLWPS